MIVRELAESQVVLEARVWVLTEAYWDVLFYLNENVKKQFDRHGITIPFNQLDVHVTRQEEAEVSSNA